MLTWLWTNAKTVKDLAEAVALLCAAGYFLWRSIAGYLFVNLSVALDVRRAAGAAGGRHHLVTVMRFTKGDRAYSSPMSASWSTRRVPWY